MAMLEKTGYLTTIKKATTQVLNPGHPRHAGIKMQAHHLLSAAGIDAAGLSDELRGWGYDINVVENLSFIPSTLQGACHLVVQLHRGDHDSPDPDAYDWDGAHPDSYHDVISRLAEDKVRQLRKKYDLCKMSPAKVRDKVQKSLDSLSKKVMKKINNHDLSLTSISSGFAPKSADFGYSGVGCRGEDSVPAASKSQYYCPVNRNHHRQQGPSQTNEDIRFSKKRYTLEVGK